MIHSFIRNQISESFPACQLLTPSLSRTAPAAYFPVQSLGFAHLKVQSPACHLFSHLVMQSLLEALLDSEGCKVSQTRQALLSLGSLNWERTESQLLLCSLKTYYFLCKQVKWYHFLLEGLGERRPLYYKSPVIKYLKLVYVLQGVYLKL